MFYGLKFSTVYLEYEEQSFSVNGECLKIVSRKVDYTTKKTNSVCLFCAKFPGNILVTKSGVGEEGEQTIWRRAYFTIFGCNITTIRPPVISFLPLDVCIYIFVVLSYHCFFTTP